MEYQEVSSTDDFIHSCNTESLSCNITGLRPVTQYRIQVIAENGVTDQDDRLGIKETRTSQSLAETQEGREYNISYVSKFCIMISTTECLSVCIFNASILINHMYNNSNQYHV